MRHRKAGKRLNRSDSHRRAMFKNMARALLTYERIRTTEVKAKELRKVVDKLITMALRNDLHARRQAYKVLGNHHLVQRLFDEIGPRFEATGGYTRIIKLSHPRKGDCAPMVIIELTKLAAAAPEEKAEEAKPAKAAAPKKEEKAEEKAPESPAEEAPAEKAEPSDEEK